MTQAQPNAKMKEQRNNLTNADTKGVDTTRLKNSKESVSFLRLKECSAMVESAKSSPPTSQLRDGWPYQNG